MEYSLAYRVTGDSIIIPQEFWVEDTSELVFSTILINYSVDDPSTIYKSVPR